MGSEMARIFALVEDLGSQLTGEPPREPTTYNPRFVLWCRSRGLEPEALGPFGVGAPTLIEDEGHVVPWTMVFSLWIQARWRDWRGLPQNKHRDRVVVDSDAEGFDAWLTGEVTRDL